MWRSVFGVGVGVADLRVAAVDAVDDAEQGGVQRRRRGEVRARRGARHAVLDARRRAPLGRHAVRAEAVVEAPVRPVAGDQPGHQPLVAVDQRRRQPGDRLVVVDQPADRLAGERAQAVGPGRVVERVGAAGHRHERHVDVQPGADRHRVGAAQVRRPVAAPGGDLAGHLLDELGGVGGGERRAVAEVDLHLPGRELGEHALEVDAPSPRRRRRTRGPARSGRRRGRRRRRGGPRRRPAASRRRPTRRARARTARARSRAAARSRAPASRRRPAPARPAGTAAAARRPVPRSSQTATSVSGSQPGRRVAASGTAARSGKPTSAA